MVINRVEDAGLTKEAHHVLAFGLALDVDARALFSQDPLAVLPEEVVQVEQTPERICRDVFEPFEDRSGGVVPSETEEYDCLGGLVADVLATKTSKIYNRI